MAIVVKALVFAGLAIQMLIRKRGKFPNNHIGSNIYMKANGVSLKPLIKRNRQKPEKSYSINDLH